MRHVAFVIDSDAYGGAAAHTGLLARHLPGDARRTIVASEPVAALVRDAVGRAAEVITVPLTRGRETAPALLHTLRALAPDVVHVNLIDPGSNTAALATATRVAPTVATLHMTGALPVTLAGAYRDVAFATAPSVEVAAQLRLLLPGQRVVRVRSGVDLPPCPVPTRDEHPVVIGAVGRLTPRKGFDVLLEAVARMMAGSGPPFRVAIAGAGREAENLAREARYLPVTFFGHIRDVPALLRGVDVFCLPSRHESLSLALLEAMAHGLPCVTTPVGDTVSEVRRAALVVPPDDPPALAAALHRLCSDPGLRLELGLRARDRAVEAFDARRMAAETAALLRHAASSRRPSPARRARRAARRPGQPDRPDTSTGRA
ncbi:glycosyltransferase family 4 protein [Bailinhaonella thermotolerans]|uniref:glycosyltransferase family 4 protein n=1 Tax=Bailinhaonella thermotolerans TaxID=1070861 RepID=UPI00192A1B1A|nr:glycosyltransferase family 4 protein [Bailinhaonella thermotolerans]